MLLKRNTSGKRAVVHAEYMYCFGLILSFFCRILFGESVLHRDTPAKVRREREREREKRKRQGGEEIGTNKREREKTSGRRGERRKETGEEGEENSVIAKVYPVLLVCKYTVHKKCFDDVPHMCNM